MTDLKATFQTSGGFFVGCNYWASHAGTRMWTEWDLDTIDKDFAGLAASGLNVLRVFPLWPDFQPLHLLRGSHGIGRQWSLGDAPLPDTEAGRAGVSETMLDRFALLADRAQVHGLSLIVGLVTGWMSGRWFVPPALEGCNVLTDPVALMWQARFVRVFVERFRSHPALAAWDLGNECNVLGQVTREEAWVWTHTVSQAVRAADPSRLLLSGMSGLSVTPERPWNIMDQAELTDVLTTHPYPPFTPHCGRDPINTLRSCLHAAAESRLYGDVGGRPCFAEELGTLGPMFASEKIAGDYIRAVLFSLWAYGCHGLLWWCAYDQKHLDFAPYDWQSVEQELGLFSCAREPKPVAGELARFGRFVHGLPFSLPAGLTDGVCLLSHGQDQWAVAYNTFVLAAQAGVTVEFQTVDQPLRDASVYLLSCVTGMRAIRYAVWRTLLERVRAGATLYISLADGFLTSLKEVIGAEVQTHQERSGAAEITVHDVDGAFVLRTQAATRLMLNPIGAEVLGTEADGGPAFLSHALGAGRVFFLSTPLEMDMALRPGAYQDSAGSDAWRVYRRVFTGCESGRIVGKDVPDVGLTEHPLSETERVVVVVNYSPVLQRCTLTITPGWRLQSVDYGETDACDPGTVSLSLPPNEAVVATFCASSSSRH